MRRDFAIVSLVVVLLVLAGADANPATQPAIRVALLGNPNTVPAWTDEQVQALADAGFNAVQLNVAWGSRPAGEPLNLNDVVGLPDAPLDPTVAKRQPELGHRIDLAKAHGP